MLTKSWAVHSLEQIYGCGKETKHYTAWITCTMCTQTYLCVRFRDRLHVVFPNSAFLYLTPICWWWFSLSMFFFKSTKYKNKFIITVGVLSSLVCILCVKIQGARHVTNCMTVAHLDLRWIKVFAQQPLSPSHYTVYLVEIMQWPLTV